MEGFMNLTAVEDNWKMFLEMHCNDDHLVITNTPLYSQIAEGFAIPLMHKLISTAADVDSPASSRNRSCRLIEDMILSNRLDAAYPTINKERTLSYFRQHALDFMLTVVCRGGGAELLLAGKELTKRLIRLSIQHNDAWNQLPHWFDLGLRFYEAQAAQRIFLRLLLEVFCEVDDDSFGMLVDNEDDLRYKFAAVLVPAVRDDENSFQFHTILVDMLAEDQGFDNMAFMILRFFHHVFTNPNHRTALMNAAIMSPFFDHPFHLGTLAAAIYLRSSIERGGEFRFSSAMISRLNGLVLLLKEWRSRRAEGGGGVSYHQQKLMNGTDLHGSLITLTNKFAGLAEDWNGHFRVMSREKKRVSTVNENLVNISAFN